MASASVRQENRLWWAILRQDSPRYEQWHKVLGSTAVPLKALASHAADLGGQETQVYDLDLSKLDAGQRQRLVDFIQERFHCNREEIERDLDDEGFPVRDEDVSVAFSLRAFI